MKVKKILLSILFMLVLCSIALAGMRKIGEFDACLLDSKSNPTTTIEVSSDDDGSLIFANDEYGMERVITNEEIDPFLNLLGAGLNELGKVASENKTTNNTPAYAKIIGNKGKRINFICSMEKMKTRTIPAIIIKFEQGNEIFSYAILEDCESFLKLFVELLEQHVEKKAQKDQKLPQSYTPPPANNPPVSQLHQSLYNQSNWSLTEAEQRKYMQDPDFVKAEEMLSTVVTVIKAKYQINDRDRYTKFISEQNTWLGTGRNEKAKDFHTNEGYAEKKECYRLATIVRAGELLEQYFGCDPTRTDHYVWTRNGNTQEFDVKQIETVDNMNVVSVSLEVRMSDGPGGGFEGMGIINENGYGFACDSSFAGFLTMKINDTSATMNFPDQSSMYLGAGARFFDDAPMQRDNPRQSPAPPTVKTPPPPQTEEQKLPMLSGHRPLTQFRARKGYVTARGLNIRAEHNTDSRVIAQAKQGASLSIVETYTDYSNSDASQYPWYKIDDLKEWGWVFGKYVASESLPLKGVVTIKNGYLNVRSDHSKTSPTVGRVEKGWRFNVVEAWASDDVPYPWFRIADNNGNGGWVSGRYFVVDGHQPNDGWRLSEDDEIEFQNHSDYIEAQGEMLQAVESIEYAEIDSKLYGQLMQGQNDWNNGRCDRVATNIYNQQGGSKRECYRLAMLQRAKEIQSALKKAEETRRRRSSRRK